MLMRRDACLFCSSQMRLLAGDCRIVPLRTGEWDRQGFYEKLCEMCGWWLWSDFTHHMVEKGNHPAFTTRHGAVGSLKEFALADQSLPIDAVRSYLAAKYDARFEVNPLILEDVVASVYRDIGYEARVTARSGDGGIDVVLDGPDGTTIAIQVKRHRATIGVEPIRSFAGALFLAGFAKGSFVTTSTFTAGAEEAANESAARGKPIELVDAKRFFEALGIAQRNVFSAVERLPEFATAHGFDFSS